MRWPRWLHVFRWWKERHTVRQREKEATIELATSRRLAAEDRVKAEKLAEDTHRNQFSDMIRDALAIGYDRPSHPRERREGT